MAIDVNNLVLDLPNNNLYRNGRLIVFPDDDEMILIREHYETVGNLEDDYHPVVMGDTLDGLAWRYYVDIVEDPSKFWWLIADANNIYNPFDWVDAWLSKSLLIPNLLNALLEIDNTLNNQI